MPHDPNVQRALSRLARAHRHPGTDPAEMTAARAGLAEAKIESAIQRALAEAPPLTREQRSRLARLFTVDGGV